MQFPFRSILGIFSCHGLLLTAFIMLARTLTATSVDDWSDQLSATEPERRAKAEKALLEAGEAALPVLADLLRTPSLAARLAAARILRKLGDPNKLSPESLALVEKPLLHSDLAELRSTYYALIPLGKEETLKVLLSGLNDPDRAVQAMVLRKLALAAQRWEARESLERLSSLEKGDPLILLHLDALRTAAAPADAAAVEKLLDEEEEEVAVRAAQVVAAWKSSASAAALVTAGFSARPDPVRVACLAALGQLGETGLKLVLARAHSPEAPVREQAASALGYFQAADRALLDLLEKDSYPRVRQAASRALQRLHRLEADSDYFLPYDASEAEQQEVIKRWRAVLQPREEKSP